MSAEVFFMNLRTKQGQSLITKLEQLIASAGLLDCVKPKDLVAIKLHFGERGNLAYVRPQYVRRLVEQIKKKGGRPFLTDANTLYVGSRSNAGDHLETAIENGFDYSVVGAPLVIADVLLAITHFKG